jgi:hypothetical protein
MSISLSMYCRCGSFVCGKATPAEADVLMQVFARLHSGEGHAPFHPGISDEEVAALARPYPEQQVARIKRVSRN